MRGGVFADPPTAPAQDDNPHAIGVAEPGAAPGSIEPVGGSAPADRRHVAIKSWGCYGCARGGRIYDLASLLAGGPWGPSLRGPAFRATQQRVAGALGLNDPAG
jgi:hypothetical protein